MNNKEKFATIILVSIGATICAVFIIGLSITIISGLVMLVCNVILPMFDIQYPITFWQGCGIGVIVSVFRVCFTNCTRGVCSQS